MNRAISVAQHAITLALRTNRDVLTPYSVTHSGNRGLLTPYDVAR